MIDDISYIKKEYFNEIAKTPHQFNQRMRERVQLKILSMYEYKYCDQKTRNTLLQEGKKLIRILRNPKFIFREMLGFLELNKIILPSYSTLQTIISNIINIEEKRLITITENKVSSNTRKELLGILADNSTLNFHELTFLKKEPKDFAFSQIRNEIKRLNLISKFYPLAASLIPELNISNENIAYYSSLVDYHTVRSLKKIKESLLIINLLCFIFFKTKKIHDNLINCFIYRVNNYTKEAITYTNEKTSNIKTDIVKHFPGVSKILEIFT
ncbi:MAG: DUF4158 domain-containing protein, partial [Oligoflexia bacterium]|nr:DUF4158 domain-containing protein [Oligoflexia bacterium]